MRFKEDHQKWLDMHIRQRTGERRSRLERGHGHGERMFLERIWWHLFGHFDHLHPEYEVLDWRGNPYYIDFAWMVGRYKFAFEIKGYGPHVQNTDRIRYRRELNRETYLQSLGFRVISIPYDELEEQPNMILSLLKSLLLPYLTNELQLPGYTRLEREALMLALRSTKPIKPVILEKELEIGHRKAISLLKKLCDKGRLKPVATTMGSKTMKYEYVHSVYDNYWD